MNLADSGGGSLAVVSTMPADAGRDVMSCVLLFAFVWLVFCGLALVTVDVFRVAWEHLENLENP